MRGSAALHALPLLETRSDAADPHARRTAVLIAANPRWRGGNHMDAETPATNPAHCRTAEYSHNLHSDWVFDGTDR